MNGTEKHGVRRRRANKKRPATLGALVSRLAEVNIELWHVEDEARHTDDHVVAAAKRQIDKLNQARNDTIEQIDEACLSLLKLKKKERARRG